MQTYFARHHRANKSAASGMIGGMSRWSRRIFKDYTTRMERPDDLLGPPWLDETVVMGCNPATRILPLLHCVTYFPHFVRRISA